MTPSSRYVYRKVGLGDLDLLAAWRARPHVCEWWGADDGYTEEEIGDPRASRWIVETGGRPFAFIQDYTVHGWEAHHFAHLPAGARGIDQFIGEPGMLGRGHGTALIAERLAALFDAGAPLIATDPHPDNARAIAVYGKLGFEICGPALETRWGVVLPMLLSR